jgi:hypothetical protein
VIEGTTATEVSFVPGCLRESTWTGAPVLEDGVDFVAPVAGTYRFRLMDRGTRAARHWDFGLSAYRAVCDADRASPVISCARAGELTGTSLASVIDVVAAAGERLPLLVTSRGVALDYRLEVALPRR